MNIQSYIFPPDLSVCQNHDHIILKYGKNLKEYDIRWQLAQQLVLAMHFGQNVISDWHIMENQIFMGMGWDKMEMRWCF